MNFFLFFGFFDCDSFIFSHVKTTELIELVISGNQIEIKSGREKNGGAEISISNACVHSIFSLSVIGRSRHYWHFVCIEREMKKFSAGISSFIWPVRPSVSLSKKRIAIGNDWDLWGRGALSPVIFHCPVSVTFI
jgi:hypothetical protein